MKAYVDPDLCIGCGLCPATCEEVFYMDEDTNLAKAKEEVPEECEGETQEARDVCPVSAISIEE